MARLLLRLGRVASLQKVRCLTEEGGDQDMSPPQRNVTQVKL